MSAIPSDIVIVRAAPPAAFQNDVPAFAPPVAPTRIPAAVSEPAWARRTLITSALLFLSLFLFVPLVAVFVQAFAKGIEVYWAALVDADAVSALKLTLIAAFIAVPLNLVFGVTAAWTITRATNAMHLA